MENQIVCPRCKKTIPINAALSDTVQGEGAFARFLLCDCGKRISYWGIAAQLDQHERTIWKFQNWIRSLSRGSRLG